ncbi:MAG: hypothetical protein HUU16_07855, partial [Candidatus Omnitrophica bacterium]|nr:hypothetical protein [Candidatus Omnitrophota bacterium]
MASPEPFQARCVAPMGASTFRKRGLPPEEHMVNLYTEFEKSARAHAERPFLTYEDQ